MRGAFLLLSLCFCIYAADQQQKPTGGFTNRDQRYRIQPNDVVEVAPRSRDSEYFKIAREGLAKKSVPRWLDLDMAGQRGRVLSAPGREDIDTSINEQLVVEFYSR